MVSDKPQLNFGQLFDVHCQANNAVVITATGLELHTFNPVVTSSVTSAQLESD